MPTFAAGIIIALVDCVPMNRILGIVQYPVIEVESELLTAKDAHIPLFARDQFVMLTAVEVTYV